MQEFNYNDLVKKSDEPKHSRTAVWKMLPDEHTRNIRSKRATFRNWIKNLQAGGFINYKKAEGTHNGFLYSDRDVAFITTFLKLHKGDGIGQEQTVSLMKSRILDNINLTPEEIKDKGKNINEIIPQIELKQLQEEKEKNMLLSEQINQIKVELEKEKENNKNLIADNLGKVILLEREIYKREASEKQTKLYKQAIDKANLQLADVNTYKRTGLFKKEKLKPIEVKEIPKIKPLKLVEERTKELYLMVREMGDNDIPESKAS